MTRSTLGPPELPSDLLMEPRAGIPLVWWICAAGALVAVAIAAFIVRARRRARVEPPPETPRVLPEDRALERLRRLRDGFATSDADAFHVELAEIVREFVEERFGVFAPRMSTEQLAEDARAAAIEPSARERVVALLRACDQVKFARARPAAPERARLAEDAESLVRALCASGR